MLPQFAVTRLYRAGLNSVSESYALAICNSASHPTRTVGASASGMTGPHLGEPVVKQICRMPFASLSLKAATIRCQ
jgi:hypothetical protein